LVGIDILELKFNRVEPTVFMLTIDFTLCIILILADETLISENAENKTQESVL
jgi:hypothetical protein